MRISSFLDRVLAIIFGSVLAAATLWSIFGTTLTGNTKDTGPLVPVPNNRHGDLVLMDAVRTVNADASTVMLSPYFSLAMDDPASCLIARRMQEKPDLTTRITTEVADAQSIKCEFVRFVRQSTRPVFERIASTRTLPIKLFAFEAFHADSWVAVGLFDQLSICNSAQEAGLKQGIGTKACTPWKPRF